MYCKSTGDLGEHRFGSIIPPILTVGAGIGFRYYPKFLFHKYPWSNRSFGIGIFGVVDSLGKKPLRTSVAS